MLARRFLAFCSADIVAGALRLQRGSRIVERLLRDERALEELARAVEGLRRLHEIRVGPLDVRRLLDVRQVLRIRRAVLGQGSGQRRLLLLVGVLLLLAIELDEDLPGRDAIAEVGEDAG